MRLKPSWCWTLWFSGCVWVDKRYCSAMRNPLNIKGVSADLPGLWSACTGAAGILPVQLFTPEEHGALSASHCCLHLCVHIWTDCSSRAHGLLFEVPLDVHLVTGPVFRCNPCRAPCWQVKCSCTSPVGVKTDGRRQSLSLFLLMAVNLSSGPPRSPTGLYSVPVLISALSPWTNWRTESPTDFCKTAPFYLPPPTSHAVF